MFCCFFFQAEDGIRDADVTGVQTRALPICRAGLDYSEYATVKIHPHYASFLETEQPARLFGLTTKGSRQYHEVAFEDGDYLMFGPETRGLPADVREGLPEAHRLRVPMQPQSRSLNLSNTAALVVYEAWRQLGFPGAV